MAIVSRIESVRPHGDNLTIVTIGDHEVVANRYSDGSFRWAAGEVCVYIPEGSIIPLEILSERGYVDDAGKGMLGGSKGNRVKMRRFAGHESVGLLFKIEGVTNGDTSHYWVSRAGQSTRGVELGDDVADYFDITPPA